MLEAYVAHYPEPLLIQPTDLSPETYTCRLRDAVTALGRNYNWNSRLWDALSFNRRWETTIVSHREGQVRIGPRPTKEQTSGDYKLVSEPKASVDQPTSELRITNWNHNTIDNGARMVNTLNGQVQLRFVGAKLTDYHQNLSNVEAVQDGDDLILL